jgi:hypothetical protein
VTPLIFFTLKIFCLKFPETSLLICCWTMKLSEVDQVLIRYADTLSMAAISFKIDGILTPEQVGSRIAVLLDTPDWLTETQQDRLVTMKMRILITQLEEMTLTSRVAEILIRALESLGTRLDRRVAATERDLTSLYAFQGMVLLEAVEKSMNYMRGRLTKGDKLAEEEWDNAKEAAIRFAQMELSSHEEGASKKAATVELEYVSVDIDPDTLHDND